ncbi:hypothetical protein SDC9_170546 [bioreactor metagenome]|uniref:Lipopolysaccharide core heptosyltransferase RfaQ n=1 Tax=bioreactor metagenome TaxID=1076179 RepID=A0A645GBI5_9ZZZZ
MNYYDRVRRYLGIPLRGDFVSPQPLPDSIDKVIFCPESSELRRSLSIENKSRLLHEIRRRWPGVKVTVAAKDGRYLRGDDEVVAIPLGKSRKDSLRFVKAIKDSDLVISVDAGPLHIAAALNVFVLGVFSSAHPLTVINFKTRAAVLRSGLLNNAYCELEKCTKPRCMDGLSLDQVILKFDAKAVRRVAYDHCPAGYSDSEVL